MRYVWSFIFPCFGSQRIRIFKGNEGTVQLAQNLIRTSNASNIVIGHHFLRGFVFEGERVILSVKSEMKNKCRLLDQNAFQGEDYFLFSPGFSHKYWMNFFGMG